MRALFEIFIKPAWYWLITIIPAALGIIGAIQSSLPESQRSRFMREIYNLLPFWGWWLFAAIAFIVTTLVSVNSYLKKHTKEHRPANKKEVHGDGIVAETVDIKAKGSSVASGRDTNLTQNYYQDKLDLPKKTKPILRIKDYGNEIKDLFGINDFTVSYDVLYIDIFNKQKIGSAKRVWSQIEWINDETGENVTHKGRWLIPTQTMRNEKVKENLQYRDIDSNQDPQRLYFAWTPKDNKKNCFYGLERNIDGHDSWGYEKYILEADEYIVKITLSGNDGVKQRFKYRVKNDNGKMSIVDALTNESKKRKR